MTTELGDRRDLASPRVVTLAVTACPPAFRNITTSALQS